MKKSLLLFSLLTGSLYPVSYNEFRSDFKASFYTPKIAQANVIDRENYMNFIEKYVVQAENSLAIVKQASGMTDIPHNEASLVLHYFNCLYLINLIMFDDFIQSNKKTQYVLHPYAGWLFHNIEEINDTWHLNIDPQVELLNTLTLLKKVNQDFCKHLGSVKRCKIRMKKRFDHFKDYLLFGIISWPWR